MAKRLQEGKPAPGVNGAAEAWRVSAGVAPAASAGLWAGLDLEGVVPSL